MESLVQQTNATIVRESALGGRILAPQDDYRNPIRIDLGQYKGLVTAYQGGELEFEFVDRTLSEGYRRAVTEAELGLTYQEFVELLSASCIRARAHVTDKSIGLVLTAWDDDKMTAIRLYLALHEPADPITVGMKVMALKAESKLIKLERAKAKALSKRFGGLMVHAREK